MPMPMPRPADPLTAYRLAVHRVGAYRYVCTQPGVRDDSGRIVYRRLRWGRLDEQQRFIPGERWLTASAEERARLIVPAEWDMSLAAASPQPGQPAPEGASGEAAGGATRQESNLLYGDVMLCEHAAAALGLDADLREACAGDDHLAELLLALAIYLQCTGEPLDHARAWQRIMKLPTATELTPSRITRTLQAVTAEHRAALIAACLRRMESGALLAVDSTTRAAYGSCPAEVRTGRIKERIVRPQTLEVVAYDLRQHLPVYYRTLQGNIPDTRTLETIITDLHRQAAAVRREVIMITDRGYESNANLRICMERGQPLLTAVRLGRAHVLRHIADLGSYGFKPAAMAFDPRTRLCHRQYDLSGWAAEKKLSDRSDEPLRLNLYLDPAQRLRELSDLHAVQAAQDEELGELLGSRLDSEERAALQRRCGYHHLAFAAPDPDGTAVLQDYAPDEDALAADALTAGFFANVTYAVAWDAMEAHRSYKLRDDQEKYFARMKGLLDGRCQRAWTERSRAGRELLLFVAGRIGSYLSHVRSTRLDWRRFPGVADMLREMRSIRCIGHADAPAHLTPAVGRQRLICQAFELCPEEHLRARENRPAAGAPRRGRRKPGQP